LNKFIIGITILTLVFVLAFLIPYLCGPPEEKVVIEITVHANSDYCDVEDWICDPPEEYRNERGNTRWNGF